MEFKYHIVNRRWMPSEQMLLG
ncbi:hypothetical protein CBM2586_B90242 [Cupriavidus phytorum]|uniref:Uncharacterized protein n=1 Tax=Cupriavidus taiwanensis TaxID=164546 RepID=A0A375CN75_9BURK|nr:hypothetical protein CBM2586_B90242 [Cupriavidus taiwanensis]